MMRIREVTLKLYRGDKKRWKLNRAKSGDKMPMILCNIHQGVITLERKLFCVQRDGPGNEVKIIEPCTSHADFSTLRSQ